MPRNTTLVIRNGNSEPLHYSGEILASGELAVAVDSGIVKVGNANAPWSGLPSIGVPSNPISIPNFYFIITSYFYEVLSN